VSHFGLFHSLAQTLLKVASPACRFLSRHRVMGLQPVDPTTAGPWTTSNDAAFWMACGRLDDDGIALAHAARQNGREERKTAGSSCKLIWRALRYRRGHAKLFRRRVHSTGSGRAAAKHVVAFARSHANESALVCAPRLIAQLLGSQLRRPLARSLVQHGPCPSG